MDNNKDKKDNKGKKTNMYVINLDLVRVFWIIAVSLFCLTFFFLVGYWLGSDTNYLVLNNNTNKKERLKKLVDGINTTHPYIRKVEQVTNLAESNALNNKNNEDSQITTPSNENPINYEPYTKNDKESTSINYKAASDKGTTNNIVYTDVRLTKASPYVIQVSTYRKRSNADKTLSLIKSKGFPAYIFTKRTKKGILHYVRIGPFAHESDTQKVQEKARRLVSLVKDSFIYKGR